MLSAMASRRTVFLDSATYVDLTSTGNLRLIRDHQVRDRIVQYFSMIERLELILEKPPLYGRIGACATTSTRKSSAARTRAERRIST